MHRHISHPVALHARLMNVRTKIVPPQPEPPQDAQPNETESDPQDSATQAETIRTLIAEIKRLVENHQQARQLSLDELQQVAIELSMAVVSHLLKEKLDAGDYPVGNMVRDAVEQLYPEKGLQVFVNPQDRQSLVQYLERQDDGLHDRIELAEDPELPRGACFVAGDHGGLLSTVEARLENMRDTLLKGIEYARAEPGKTNRVGRTWRRLPERRKPA